MNIPVQAVEAAAQASFCHHNAKTPEEWEAETDLIYKGEYLHDAWTQLQAAAPIIAAQALGQTDLPAATEEMYAGKGARPVTESSGWLGKLFRRG